MIIAKTRAARRRDQSTFWAALGCLLLCPVAVAQLRTAEDRPVDIRHIRLDLAIELKEKQISGTATIDLVPLRPIDALQLDAVDHDVASVRDEQGRTLAFSNTGKEIRIELGPTRAGERRKVVIAYTVRDPKDGLFFFAPTDAEPNVPLTAWTQGEPVSNRYWFPCLDNPNERQTTELVATAPAGFEILSNGKLLEKKQLPDGHVQFHWRQDEPHVAYLVTMVVGKFSIGRAKWRNTPVLYYVPPERAADTARTFGDTLEMLEYFSKTFGTDYPWSQYAQVVVEQFTMGGMENTSATTLNDRVLHDERAILDSSPNGLIAHELGHQWWGDLVTCKDWSHIWLNEGFATYCEVLWDEHKLGRDEAVYTLYEKSRSAKSGTTKTRPVVDRNYSASANVFDDRAYPKGGWILHMLRCRLGDEAFFAGLKRYATDFRFQTVETADFRLVLERMSGRSLERFFFDWTERPGHPELAIDSRLEPDGKLVRIAIRQTQPEEPFHLPLRIELFGEAQQAPVVVEKELQERELLLYVPVSYRPAGIRIDPQYTLLATIRETKTNEWWEKQLFGGSVGERLRAVEHLSGSKSDSDRRSLAAALKGDKFYGVRVEAASALGKSGGDVARDALIDALGAEHPKVRRASVDALATFVGDAKVLDALTRHLSKAEPSYFVEAAVLGACAKVERAPKLDLFAAGLAKDSHGEVIRQAALRGVAECNDPKALDVLLEWTRRGKPRNCRVTALRAIPLHLAKHPHAKTRESAVVEAVMVCLTGEGRAVLRAAIEALRDLANAARPATRLLDAIALHDADPPTRDLAKAALARIRSDTPAPLELARLRDELDQLKKTNQTLTERVQKLEGTAKK